MSAPSNQAAAKRPPHRGTIQQINDHRPAPAATQLPPARLDDRGQPLKPISTFVPDEARRRVKAFAATRGLTMQTLIAKALNDFLEAAGQGRPLPEKPRRA